MFSSKRYRRRGISRQISAHSPVQLAIAEWQNKQITGTELMRRLVSFDKWMLPVSEAAAAEMVSTGAASRLMYSQDGEGVSRLYLFSDGEAYNAFRASVGQDASEQHFLSTTGTWIFQLPLDPLDFIEIDPATPWQIGYHKEQFPRLRAMAAAVEVEQALAALRAGTAEPGSLTKVRQYEHYILAVTSLDGGYTLALAPDDRDRTLAAIFTSDDTFEAFLPEGEALLSEGQLLRVALAGPQLFEQLSRMSLDGVVFNCSGPGRPIAFAQAFLTVVLEAKPGE